MKTVKIINPNYTRRRQLLYLAKGDPGYLLTNNEKEALELNVSEAQALIKTLEVSDNRIFHGLEIN